MQRFTPQKALVSSAFFMPFWSVALLYQAGTASFFIADQKIQNPSAPMLSVRDFGVRKSRHPGFPNEMRNH
jgi:hypothetical protein